MKNAQIFAYACGMGAQSPGCDLGPKALLDARLLEGGADIPLATEVEYFHCGNKSAHSVIENISNLNRRLAEAVSVKLKNQAFPVVIGGDHSCAVGTWSGAQNVIGSLGLLWLDAHMDSHTPSTSPSGNIHGMPLASLLGYGPKDLTELLHAQPKIDPRNVCLLGVRSYELEEQRLLQQLGVKIFFAEDIEKLGLKKCMQLALQHINRYSRGFGISIDLDVFDPTDIPGVGSPEPNGIKIQTFIDSLDALQPWKERFYGLEIAEFNPRFDQEGKTALWVNQLLHRLLRLKVNSTQPH